MEKLAELYKRWKGTIPATVAQLPEAGSNRKYYRLTDSDGESVIGVVGNSREPHLYIPYQSFYGKAIARAAYFGRGRR